MRLLVILALVFVIAVALMTILRRSGPRVTHIEHRRDDTERKDDDDA